jgi:uncharacterized membrane protein (UPF0127 family)
MSQLNTPFEQTTSLILSSRNQRLKIKTELATSDIEIFQALNYRTKKEFSNPLTLKFSNPLAQSFVKINFSFPVEMIAVDYLTHKVKKTQFIPAKKEGGDFIQGFSEYSVVIFASKGFCKKNKIEEAFTTITIK